MKNRIALIVPWSGPRPWYWDLWRQSAAGLPFDILTLEQPLSYFESRINTFSTQGVTECDSAVRVSADVSRSQFRNSLIADAKASCVPTPHPLFSIARTFSHLPQDNEQLFNLACVLGVSPASLASLDVRWDAFAHAWAFPMRDASGTVVGIRYRSSDGSKWSARGSHDGLFIPVIEPQEDDQNASRYRDRNKMVSESKMPTPAASRRTYPPSAASFAQQSGYRGAYFDSATACVQDPGLVGADHRYPPAKQPEGAPRRGAARPDGNSAPRTQGVAECDSASTLQERKAIQNTNMSSAYSRVVDISCSESLL